jgi:hypothetical protein
MNRIARPARRMKQSKNIYEASRSNTMKLPLRRTLQRSVRY